MSTVDRLVMQREVGSLPLSISTSLAIATACGVNPDLPMERAPILDYDHLFVNVRTLIRNIATALPTVIKNVLTAKNVIHSLLEEMIIIEAAVASASGGKTRVSYYGCTLEGLRREFPYALLVMPSTDIQKHYHKYEQDTFKLIPEFNHAHDYHQYDVSITDRYQNEKCLMLTHHPLDLLNYKHYGDLHLLESHTASIKKRSEWYTKLTKGKELERIPFNRITLQIFGDNNQVFGQMPHKTKETVKALAEEKYWTLATTEEKVLFDLSRHPDMTFRAQMLMLVK